MSEALDASSPAPAAPTPPPSAQVPTPTPTPPAPTPTPPTPPHRCLNCGAPLRGAYCEACGQAAHVHRSLLHLVEELLHGVFHFDAKGWRTLPLLVGRPGLLTRRYIDGQRVRYVSPLALFLFTIFLMFFAASLGSSPPLHLDASDAAKVELMADLSKARTEEAEAGRRLADARRSGAGVADREEELTEAKQEVAIAERALKSLGGPSLAQEPASASASASASGSASASAPTPASAVASAASRASRHAFKRGLNVGVQGGYTDIHWLDQGFKHALANPELTIYKLKSSAYKYSFMLVPISLPFLWLLFLFRRGVTIYDHAIFVLYSLSFMSLLFVLLVGLSAAGMPAAVIVALSLLVPPVHMGLQLRETYGLGLWATLWRTAALIVVASLVFMLFVFFLAYVVLA